jgi:hypothetical protein
MVPPLTNSLPGGLGLGIRSIPRYKEVVLRSSAKPRRAVVTLYVADTPGTRLWAFWRSPGVTNLAALHTPGPSACASRPAPRSLFPGRAERKTPEYQAAGEVALVAAALIQPRHPSRSPDARVRQKVEDGFPINGALSPSTGLVRSVDAGEVGWSGVFRHSS